MKHLLSGSSSSTDLVTIDQNLRTKWRDVSISHTHTVIQSRECYSIILANLLYCEDTEKLNITVFDKTRRFGTFLRMVRVFMRCDNFTCCEGSQLQDVKINLVIFLPSWVVVPELLNCRSEVSLKDSRRKGRNVHQR